MGLLQDAYRRDAEFAAGIYAERLLKTLESEGITGYDKDFIKNLLINEIGDTPGEFSLAVKDIFGGIGEFFGVPDDEPEGWETNFDAATEQLLRELRNASQLGDAPEVSLDSAMASAKEEIDAEIAQQEQALADLLTQQTASYNAAAEQMLSSDYQRNASLMSTYQSEMRRAQRNALEAGASAGARLANNINVTLSTQNQQAQQSLETSNNLAQMLLNQRQAASDIGQQRVGLRSGYTARVNAYGQQKYADQQTRLGEWETRARDKITGGLASPYADPILAKRRNQQYSSTGNSSTYGT